MILVPLRPDADFGAEVRRGEDQKVVGRVERDGHGQVVQDQIGQAHVRARRLVWGLAVGEGVRVSGGGTEKRDAGTVDP